ncbi:hypothetical protein MASR2M64_05730 [Candidatus Cloacimonadota bacterium]
MIEIMPNVVISLVLLYCIVYLLGYFANTKQWIDKVSGSKKEITTSLSLKDIFSFLLKISSSTNSKIAFFDGKQCIIKIKPNLDHFGLVVRIVIRDNGSSRSVIIYGFYVFPMLVKTAINRELKDIDYKLRIMELYK